jgi:8-oxo-dGTP diphosphatase
MNNPPIRGIDYIGVGVGACIINNEEKILLCKRGAKAKNERGLWEIPGGAVELNETLEEALKREIKEEIGVDIEIIRLLHVVSHIIKKEHQHWVSPTYICKIISGFPVIKEPEKCDEIGWFSISVAQKLPLSIVTIEDIEKLKSITFPIM